jgi:hypothetical protein
MRQSSDTESRYWVFDRKVGPLSQFSAINPRYWVMDRRTGQIVDEFSTKAPATATARDLNRAQRVATT